MYLACHLASSMILHSKFLKELDKNENCCSYIYEYEKMEINASNYMIKFLPYVLVNFQAAIYKSLLLAKCRAF